MGVYICMCVCVCVYIYILMCVCVCVCVCMYVQYHSEMLYTPFSKCPLASSLTFKTFWQATVPHHRSTAIT